MSVPKRFRVAGRVLWFDRFMTHFIKLGGIGIITAVLAIFAFILWQIIPLFRGARVEPLQTLQLPTAEYQIFGMDEWAELPFVLTADGRFLFIDLQQGKKMSEEQLPLEDPQKPLRLAYSEDTNTIAVATDTEQIVFVKVDYEAQFSDGHRHISHTLTASPSYPLVPPPDPPAEASTISTSQATAPQPQSSVKIVDMSLGDAEDAKMVGLILEADNQRQVRVLRFGRENSLLGEGALSLEARYDLSSSINGNAAFIRVNETADMVLVGNDKGSIFYFAMTDGDLKLIQEFDPFGDLSDATVASANFVLGGVSVYVSHPSGLNRLFSLFIPEGRRERLFGQTKEFPPLPGPVTAFSKSLRNKAFLVGAEKTASLRYATTAEVRWKTVMPYPVELVGLSRKYKAIGLLDTKDKLHLYALHDPHPEAGWRAFFGKLWYEGANKPSYAWQSTGGSDAFEPKLSLIPLIIGTLKGTLYAMVFALPIALLAALYTSQFMDPKYKGIIKPIMEIMASLPSVILGFLAALWLAPILDDKVPSVMLVVVMVPAATLLLGWLWIRLPRSVRRWVPQGSEAFFLIPMVFIVAVLAWKLGPFLERWLFVVTDPTTGKPVADFRLWWPQVTGTSFEQRNSLVVGFVMGFAVIPIIFTITEDSLSAVPLSLKSAALALGASRWQTAWRIVVPTAAAGIFSAVMIGLGRAVGETMIVLMATGNTPVMNFDIFSGMRTLSANLAVELPEAPYLGTLFRTLFLGAMVLFLMTFVVNTLAEILRQYLRQRFRVM